MGGSERERGEKEHGAGEGDRTQHNGIVGEGRERGGEKHGGSHLDHIKAYKKINQYILTIFLNTQFTVTPFPIIPFSFMCEIRLMFRSGSDP